MKSLRRNRGSGNYNQVANLDSDSSSGYQSLGGNRYIFKTRVNVCPMSCPACLESNFVEQTAHVGKPVERDLCVSLDGIVETSPKTKDVVHKFPWSALKSWKFPEDDVGCVFTVKQKNWTDNLAFAYDLLGQAQSFQEILQETMLEVVKKTNRKSPPSITTSPLGSPPRSVSPPPQVVPVNAAVGKTKTRSGSAVPAHLQVPEQRQRSSSTNSKTKRRSWSFRKRTNSHNPGATPSNTQSDFKPFRSKKDNVFDVESVACDFGCLSCLATGYVTSDNDRFSRTLKLSINGIDESDGETLVHRWTWKQIRTWRFPDDNLGVSFTIRHAQMNTEQIHVFDLCGQTLEFKIALNDMVEEVAASRN